MSEPEAARHKLHWLPNALTVSRILLIPVLVWGILSVGKHYLGVGTENYTLVSTLVLCLFCLCVVTDYLDGHFARTWKITSDFGRMLDPIADKLLVAGCLIALCLNYFGDPAILIPALIIIGRDIFVSGIREHAANANIILTPTKLAKWKTAIEMLAITTFLVGFVVFDVAHDARIDTSSEPPKGTRNTISEIITLFGVTMLWLAAILSAYTGFHYFRSAMRKPE